MELQLALTLSSNASACKYETKEVVASNILKRTYDEAFEEVNSTDVLQTLPLFVWKSNGEEEREEGLEKKHSAHDKKNDEDENSIIGWPPIKSWRKKLYYQNHLSSTANYVTVENRGGGRGSNPNSMYVKVKMEGVGIARKVDLSLHHSFQTLTDTLIRMFGKYQENVQAYKLTYQDKDGDWLLAGDIPWGTFIRSVQRLKLLKSID